MVHSDWSVETPHDLEVARVARALGADAGCLRLVDDVLPVARTWLALQARTALPTIELADGWRPIDRAPQCCQPFPRGWTAAEVGQHVRGAAHLAAVSGISRRALSSITSRLRQAELAAIADVEHSLDFKTAHDCVSEHGFRDLWEAGLHPAWVADVHAQTGSGRTPLPPRFFLDVLIHRPDLAWIAETLRCAAEPQWPSVVCWLAVSETELDRREPEARRAWLRLGVPPRLIEQLSAAGYRAAEALALATVTGRTLVGAAQILAMWADAGCHPTVEQLAQLQSAGLSVVDQHLSATVVNRLDHLLHGDGIKLDRTQLGALFMAAGSARTAHSWVRAGVVDPVEITRRIEQGLTPLSTQEGAA